MVYVVAFVPLWMYTIGQYIIGESTIQLPFANMAQTLALVIVPLSLGMLVKRFLPRVAGKLIYMQKPSIVLIMVFAGGMSKC